MATVGDTISRSEYTRVRNELHQTVRVLSVLAELLLKETDGQTLEIDDMALLDAPDLKAWRDTKRNVTCISISREA